MRDRLRLQTYSDERAGAMRFRHCFEGTRMECRLPRARRTYLVASQALLAVARVPAESCQTPSDAIVRDTLQRSGLMLRVVQLCDAQIRAAAGSTTLLD